MHVDFACILYICLVCSSQDATKGITGGFGVLEEDAVGFLDFAMGADAPPPAPLISKQPKKRVGIDKKVLTAEKLHDLYSLYPDHVIGQQFNVTDACIRGWRRKYGIPTMSERQRREQQVPEGQLSLDDMTPALLADLYSRMGIQNIAKLYHVGKPSIVRLLRKWGITTLSKSERSTSKESLTDRQKQIIMGTLLGDGFLSEKGFLKVEHSVDQYTYLSWMHQQLSTIAKDLRYIESVMPQTGQTKCGYLFKTVQHSWLCGLRRIFYPDGVKVFPTAVLQQLEPIGLACWYMDDGHLDVSTPSFALGNISLEAANTVCSDVYHRFGIQAYIKNTSQDTTCKVMVVKGGYTEVFFNLVKPFITADLWYKVPVQYRPFEGVTVKRKTVTDTILPKQLTAKAKEWPELSLADKDVYLQDVLAFWQNKGFPYQQPDISEIAALTHLQWSHAVKDSAIGVRVAGQATCQSFQPHLWDVCNVSAKESPKTLFDTKLSDVLRYLLEQGQIPNAGNLRAALRYYRYSGVYNFRPAIAKVLIDRFGKRNGVVYDPCAGWGGRLLGSILSSTNSTYVACEPSTKTYAGLQNMLAWLGNYLPQIGTRVSLHCLPAEDFDPPKCDVVLTSPPYWCKELYAEEPTQSYLRYPSYSEWLSKFWTVVLQKALSKLNPCGQVLLNVDDFTVAGIQYPLIQDTKDIMERLGFGQPEVFKYGMPSPQNKENHEVILCWRASAGYSPIEVIEEPSKAVEISPLQGLLTTHALSRCLHCRQAVPVGGLIDGFCTSCQTQHICKKCGISLMGLDKRLLHCAPCKLSIDAERARAKRQTHKSKTPTYTYTCTSCAQQWTLPSWGHFTLCTACKEQREIARVTKTCQYRHCGRTFTDTSLKNSSKFCHDEHRRREKLFRSGTALDLGYFKKPDPVLERDKVSKAQRTCITCRQTFVLGDTEMYNRCPECRLAARNKVCPKCLTNYQDVSLNNTSRYCLACH